MEEAGGYPVPKQLNIDRNLDPASFFFDRFTFSEALILISVSLSFCFMFLFDVLTKDLLMRSTLLAEL